MDLQIDSAAQHGFTAQIVANEQGDPVALARDWAGYIAVKTSWTKQDKNHAAVVFSSPTLMGTIKFTSICTGGTRLEFDMTGPAMLTPHG